MCNLKVKECGNQFEILAGSVFLGVPNSCPVDLDGKKRELPAGADALSGVSLYVSDETGNNFHEACVPTTLNVSLKKSQNFSKYTGKINSTQ